MVAGARTPAHTLYLNLNEDDSFTGPLAPAPTPAPAGYLRATRQASAAFIANAANILAQVPHLAQV